jgi:hypothetical protein
MLRCYRAVGATVALAVVTAVCGAAPPRAASAAAGHAVLHAYGTRSAQQLESPTARKLDTVLADLARHASRARSGSALADLRVLSPAARFRQTAPTAAPLVLIDAVTRADPAVLKAQLLSLGLQHAAVYANDVGGWLPVTQIDAASALSTLVSLRAALPHARTGSVESQGDFAQGTAQLRSTYPTLTGRGITIGVLSDSFNCYAAYAAPGSGVPVSGQQGYAPNGFTADAERDVATGDLPANVDVLEEADCLDYGYPTQLPFTDEGRALLQVAYDVAPGSSLAFYTADNSEADFATGIGALAAAGATVEADDVGYFDEPFYQDGIVAQAIDSVEAQGVAYFSAAGNDSNLSYENTAPSFGTLARSGPNQGEYLLNFDTTGATTTTSLTVTIPALYPGEFIPVVVEWDQPYVTGAPGSPGASSAIDLCITGASGNDQIVDLDGNGTSCTGPNASGVDPVQILIIGNPANSSGNSGQETLTVMVGLADGTAPPGRIKVAVEDDGAGASIDEFQTDSATLQGHPGAAGALAIGAAFFPQTPLCGTSPAVLESYSSWGGDPILFDTSGNRLSSPLTRQKPDVVGPDGINTTFFGWPLSTYGQSDDSSVAQCQNNANYPNFFGTSAATPHVAGIAALMRQSNSALTPTQIYTALRSTAAAMGGNAPNYQSGYGFVMAEAALATLPPGSPTLTLSASSVAVGSSTTLTWSSINTTGCTASGAWSGTVASSGSRTITATAAGNDTYTLSCSNAAGSAVSSVNLNVTDPPSSGSGGGGGGGGLDVLSLCWLAAAAVVRLSGRVRARTCLK